MSQINPLGINPKKYFQVASNLSATGTKNSSLVLDMDTNDFYLVDDDGNTTNVSSSSGSLINYKRTFTPQELIDSTNNGTLIINAPGENKFINFIGGKVYIDFNTRSFSTSNGLQILYSNPLGQYALRDSDTLQSNISMFRTFLDNNPFESPTFYMPINSDVLIQALDIPTINKIIIQEDSGVGTFSNGELIIGQNSGATGLIDKNAPLGSYYVNELNGIFQENETFVGDESGAEAIVQVFDYVSDSNFTVYLTYQILDV